MPVRGEPALGEIVEEEPAAAPSRMKQLYHYIGKLFTAADAEQENQEANDEPVKEEEEENVQNHEDIMLF